MEVPEEDRELVARHYDSYEDKTRALVPHYFLKIWNTGDLALTRLIWSPDIVFHSPIGGETINGYDGLLEFAKAIHLAFTNFHYDVEDLIVSGDRVVFRMRQTGIHTGDYFGIPPTGLPVEMSEVFIFRTAPKGPVGVMIEEVWLRFNVLHLMQQLKLFPTGNPPRPMFRAIIAFQKLFRIGRRKRGAPAPS